MKTILAIMALMFAVTTFAEEGKEEKSRSPEQIRHRDRAGDFFKPLNLTEDQQKQIKEIMKSHREEMKVEWQKKQKDLPKGEKPDKEQVRKQMEEKNKALNEKIKAVLTSEQIPQYDKLVAEKKAAFKRKRDQYGDKGRGPRPPQGPPAMQRVFKSLDLTDKQQEQIKAMHEKHREQIKALMESVRKGHQAEIKSVLTPEQQKKYDEMMERVKEMRKRQQQGDKDRGKKGQGRRSKEDGVSGQ